MRRAQTEESRLASGLPGALLVTMHAQLLAPFMPVNFCLAAFLE